MGKALKELLLDTFAGGLNSTDSPHDIQDNQLQIAQNVKFAPTGEATSIEGHLQVGNPITINSLPATKVIGGIIFQNLPYLMASNGTEARLVYKDTTLTGSITAFADAGSGQVTVTDAAHGLFDNDIVTITGTTNYNGTFTITNKTTNTFEIIDTFVSDDATGTWTSIGWTEVSSENFDKDTRCDMIVESSNIWFVNGLTTNSNVLHFVNTSNVLSGLPISSGLESGINRIVAHAERVWISKSNKIFVSKQFPAATAADWDAGTVYSGSNTAGLITLDNNTEDSIKRMIAHFGQLVVFREFTIHTVTGKVILTSTIEKAFNSKGAVSDFSIGQADKMLYFLSAQAVKQFQGVTVQDQTTQFDSISSIGIDRQIRSNIESFSDQSAAIGHAFQDRYYLSDGTTQIFVFDELTGGWSQWTQLGAELFLEEGKSLFCAADGKYYEMDADTTTSLTSHIQTKDFNLETDQLIKLFDKLLATFKTFPSSMTVTLEWYVNGENIPTGTKIMTVVSDGINYDSGYFYDSGIRYDVTSINFDTQKQRNLLSGVTIAFGIKAEGINRFSLSALDLLYELTKKET